MSTNQPSVQGVELHGPGHRSQLVVAADDDRPGQAALLAAQADDSPVITDRLGPDALAIVYKWLPAYDQRNFMAACK